MNLISALLLLALAAAPMAVLAGWLVGRRAPRVGTLVRVGGSSDDWWRETLPWPPGVQEDDEVHWNFASPDERADHEDGAAMRVEPAPLAVRLQAVRPGLRGRQPGR